MRLSVLSSAPNWKPHEATVLSPGEPPMKQLRSLILPALSAAAIRASYSTRMAGALNSCLTQATSSAPPLRSAPGSVGPALPTSIHRAAQSFDAKPSS